MPSGVSLFLTVDFPVLSARGGQGSLARERFLQCTGVRKIMRRYGFLTKDSVYGALNKLRSAFLAAKDGSEVEEIIKAVLTFDERMKIGRRLQIAQLLNQGISYEEIKEQLKVGFTTINFVERSLRDHPDAYELINRREDKVEQEYKAGAYRRTGGSTLVFKRSEYTGLKRKDIHR